MHPSLRQLVAFVDGDAHERGTERLASHLRACQRCRNEVAAMRTVVRVARDRAIPEPRPELLDTILARRMAGERRILPRIDDGAPPTTRRRAFRVGLGLVVVGAAAAAALPASPLRRWLNRLVGEGATATPTSPRRADTTSTPANAASAPPVIAGVSVAAAEDLWVTIDDARDDLRVHVQLGDGNELDVRGSGNAASAVFRPRANGVGVQDAGAGEMEIVVPRSAVRFTLRVNGSVLVVKNGDRLRRLATDSDSSATEFVITPQAARRNAP